MNSYFIIYRVLFYLMLFASYLFFIFQFSSTFKLLFSFPLFLDLLFFLSWVLYGGEATKHVPYYLDKWKIGVTFYHSVWSSTHVNSTAVYNALCKSVSDILVLFLFFCIFHVLQFSIWFSFYNHYFSSIDISCGVI